MSRIAYVNGRYVNQRDAMVHIEDRGYQFADGIYEYIAFYHHTPLDLGLHLARLERSLKELRIPAPMSMAAFRLVLRELVERNVRADGGIYIQITRGVAMRDHPFPKTPLAPSLVAAVYGPKIPKEREVAEGVRVITRPDNRWGRCDVKSVALLANVLAKQEAAAAGVREAWLTRPDGTVTEGAVSNAFIVTEADGIMTHPAGRHILSGVTRDVMLALARGNGIAVTERAFTVAEAKEAQEAFITSTSANVLPVVKIDDAVIGNGKPGEVAKKLLALYHAHIKAQTGKVFA